MNIGLYFGTFNPIHVGHLIIANHLVEYTELDQVWLVVTPHNPHKEKSTLLNDYHRLHMVHLAIEEYPKLRASDVEFRLPQPNYTAHTLAHLGEKYPQHEFSLIMGEDNVHSLPRWKNFKFLIKEYPIYVYPRILGPQQPWPEWPEARIIRVDAPVIELSATHIREAIKERKNVLPLLPTAVWKYIDHNLFYR